MNLEQEFEEFMRRLYQGENVTDRQYGEMKKAYFGGCFTLFTALMEATLDEDDEVCEKQVSELGEQIQTAIKRMMPDA